MLVTDKREIGTQPILKVNHLTVNFGTLDGDVPALSDIDFEIKEGEILGIIGESGSGKTTLALSLMSLLPDNARVDGNVVFNRKVVSDEGSDSGYQEEEITSSKHSGSAYFKIPKKYKRVLDERLTTIRWKEISMVFQGAMNSLNPVYTVRKQLREVFTLHGYSKENNYAEIDKRVAESADAAGFNKKFLDSFPHQLSGGMKQRAVITMALALDPQLIIADEPTTGLDVITQAKIIREFKRLRQEGKIRSMVIISHDVGVVSQLADRVAVLYAGRVMEIGKASDIFLKPANPYSKALMESYPSIRSTRKFVSGIPGAVPDLLNLPKGCYFAPRCFYAQPKCSSEPPEIAQVGNEHYSLCHFATGFYSEASTINLNNDAAGQNMWGGSEYKSNETLIETQDLCKFFQLSATTASKLFARGAQRVVRAVDHISFKIEKRQVIGVVGESGSGKTTLGRAILLSIPPTSGELRFNFHDPEIEGMHEISKLKEGQPIYRSYRRDTQMVFQDPYDSINPKMSVFDIVNEPVNAHRRDLGKKMELTNEKITEMIESALEIAKLSPPSNYINRYPHELSGGERQRVSIARALILRPGLLVADEPISMLDVSIRANVMNLLVRLKEEFGMSIIYISHDIASARYVSDRLLVMYLGVAVEFGNTEDVINNPLHPYTKALIQAVPTPDPNWSSGNLKIIGEVGNAVEVHKGCRFYDRCVYRKDLCKDNPPPMKTKGSSYYICHFEQEYLVENPEVPDVVEGAVESDLDKTVKSTNSEEEDGNN